MFPGLYLLAMSTLSPLCVVCVCVTGAKEIDIAATLEHLRDQRPGMVQTKVTLTHTPHTKGNRRNERCNNQETLIPFMIISRCEG